ncbi:hypothetical protein CY35_05G082900 [Sphagnum magellanicum]|nr:hypothetical protein CY35_05G082900 [Sphagnum magellanicum]
MDTDLEQQLRLVEQELSQVQDQIQSLLHHQESLLQQQSELQGLLASCRTENDSHKGISKSSKEDWSGPFEWDDRAADIRLNVFGIASYRQNQREIINAVMSGRDVIVIMAAGGGKSLCYQLPALLLSGTALVVSPLLSLIQDQVMGLTALGIAAGMLTSTTTKDEEKSIYRSLEKGEGELRILYVTPEKIAKSKRFVSKLEKCNHAGHLSLVAIDEAHCCSQWGHDFRPDYKNLGILKKQFPKVPMIALTATATERVQTDLREMLQISCCAKFVSSINRPNLFYEVREKNATGSGAIDDIAEFIADFYPGNQSGIVYCFSRRECEQVAGELRERGISAAHYHADMDPVSRSSVHRRWSTNKLQVIVGTVAFGMGINKPDVRFVIHHSLSKSLETYYQESGRAGRDGLPSHCLLFFRPADLPRQSSMVFAEVSGLLNLYDIARFCQSKRGCRRAAFFRHFGERVQECNGMCDNCAFSKEIVDMDVTEHAKSLVTIVKETSDVDQKSTMLQLVDLWRSRARQPGNRKVKLEIIKGVHSVKKGAKAARNKSSSDDEEMKSGMGRMLDELRFKLATDHGGIFPHSVLSSQHITALCSSKPVSLDQVEQITGKRIAEKYGKEILASISGYIEKNPDSPSKTGLWVTPKGRVSSALISYSLEKPTLHRLYDVCITSLGD